MGSTKIREFQGGQTAAAQGRYGRVMLAGSPKSFVRDCASAYGVPNQIIRKTMVETYEKHGQTSFQQVVTLRKHGCKNCQTHYKHRQTTNVKTSGKHRQTQLNIAKHNCTHRQTNRNIVKQVANIVKTKW
jgi:hypothetical protein